MKKNVKSKLGKLKVQPLSKKQQKEIKGGTATNNNTDNNITDIIITDIIDN